MADPITITVSSATVILVAERVFAYVVTPRLKTKAEARAFLTSGEQDPAFWKAEFRAAVDEKLDQRVMPILDNQQKILESLARTQEGIATVVKELADVSRARRR